MRNRIRSRYDLGDRVVAWRGSSLDGRARIQNPHARLHERRGRLVTCVLAPAHGCSSSSTVASLPGTFGRRRDRSLRASRSLTIAEGPCSAEPGPSICAGEPSYTSLEPSLRLTRDKCQVPGLQKRLTADPFLARAGETVMTLFWH